ncbi:Restriction endonuclease subunit S [Hyella patelloides LEGE 07179]|uniref:Restriction endonuclease subunit S n=1 Tax=Hyella patelloides LEGE 07179 TaxID=945734 RepID=A0A563W4X9_9CYAN|nr:restriction endonuclease subunit S [Hyella patelloides]VEP18751.1 Restriction endonuclease subunit S [Hyella patelloides LEGE 07179]
MGIPSEIQYIIERLNIELDYIQEQTQHGLGILKPLLNRFPNNNLLVQFYGYLNNSLFVVDVYKRRIQIIIELLQQENLSSEEIQATGEELSNLQGKTIESKIGLENIIQRLEALL